MNHTRIPETIRRVITETFTAKDVAEPLASFDAEASSASVSEFMEAQDFDVVGIRKNGQIAGFVERHVCT